MSKEMVISANPHETRVAIMEDGQLCEYYVEREKEFALVGSIYKGRVTRVLPGMQSAFVEIGLDSDAFLYVTDFLEGVEEFDNITTTVEEKVQKMEDQGGRVFPVEGSGAAATEPLDVEGGAPTGEPGADAPAALHDAIGGNETGQMDAQPMASAAGAGAPHTSSRGNAPFRPPHQDQDRGRYGNRGREGRDFGRRGGGGGGRGRGGRFGRRSGGGGGGDRQFGRDLPQSKYASHRPYDAPSGDEAPASGDTTPIILPGESLAKYREKAPGAAGVTGAEEHTHAHTESAAHETHTGADHTQEPAAEHEAGHAEGHADTEAAEPRASSHAPAAFERESRSSHSHSRYGRGRHDSRSHSDSR